MLDLVENKLIQIISFVMTIVLLNSILFAISEKQACRCALASLFPRFVRRLVGTLTIFILIGGSNKYVFHNLTKRELSVVGQYELSQHVPVRKGLKIQRTKPCKGRYSDDTKRPVRQEVQRVAE